MNINFALKLKLIILVFVIAIGSSCLAMEVIEFNQDTLISEIKKDEHKYEHLNKYFKDMGEVGLCELLSNYVAYRRLLNEESVDQISDTEVVLSDLQTILRVVEMDKKRLKFTVYSKEEQNKVTDELASLFNEYSQALYDKEYQLAEKTSERLDGVIKSWWREMSTKDQLPCGLGIAMNNAIFSAYNIFDLHFTPWIVSKDSSDLLIVNEQLFGSTMENMKIGTYINFYVLNQIGKDINGHAMLITKNKDDNFAFFDPSSGIILNLTIDELFKLVNDTLRFLKEKIYHNTGDIIVLFNNNMKAAEGIKSKFVVIVQLHYIF